MKISPSAIAWLICSSLGCFSAYAQATPAAAPPAAGPAQTAPDLKPVTDALKFRTDMAASVGSGAEASDAAVIRLKAQTAPSGLQIDPDADFAIAAVDIGQRLIAAGKPAGAAAFFQEAEKSLTLMIQKTPDKSALEKAQYFSMRANIRAQFLNEPAAAKTDIDAAISLQPNNAYFTQLRAVLASSRAEFFKDPPTN